MDEYIKHPCAGIDMFIYTVNIMHRHKRVDWIKLVTRLVVSFLCSLVPWRMEFAADGHFVFHFSCFLDLFLLTSLASWLLWLL